MVAPNMRLIITSTSWYTNFRNTTEMLQKSLPKRWARCKRKCDLHSRCHRFDLRHQLSIHFKAGWRQDRYTWGACHVAISFLCEGLIRRRIHFPTVFLTDVIVQYASGKIRNVEGLCIGRKLLSLNIRCLWNYCRNMCRVDAFFSTHHSIAHSGRQSTSDKNS